MEPDHEAESRLRMGRLFAATAPAVAAMREPTEAMVIAGAAELERESEIDALVVYYAMIDAALK